MEFRYKTSFSSVIKPLVSEETDKFLAIASLSEIGKYIPEVNVSKNVDLLPISFDAFVANRFNKNDDGADAATSVSIAKLSVNKPINIEHKRDKVMGVVLSYAFTDFASHKQLSEKEALESKDPFYVTLGGLLWRVVNQKLAKKVEECSDPTSENYRFISASWELGFLDFAIAAIKNGSKNLKDATIITNPDEIQKLEGYLRAYNGKGSLKDEKLYRLVQGDVLPLGFALTASPAADVKGIATNYSLDSNEEPEETNAATSDEQKTATKMGINTTESATKEEKTQNLVKNTCPACGAISNTAVIRQNDKEGMTHCNSCGKSTLSKLWKEFHASENPLGEVTTNTEKFEKSLEIISQTEKNIVIQERKAIAMSVKITKLEDITDDLLKQASASEVTQWVKDELNKAGEAYKAEKNKVDTELKESKAAYEKLQTDQVKLQEDLKKVNESLAALQKEKEAREKQDAFNGRMASLDIDFELSKEEREVIASDIANLDDNGFSAYRKKLDVLLAAKKKGKQSMDKQKANPDEGNNSTGPGKNMTKNGNGDDGDDDDMPKKESKASTKEEGKAALEEAVDNADKTKAEVPVTARASEAEGFEKYAKAFGVDQWISDVDLTK